MTFENLHATAEEILAHHDTPMDRVPVRVLAQAYLNSAQIISSQIEAWKTTVEGLNQVIELIDVGNVESARNNLQVLARILRSGLGGVQ